jgi:hypothetical protein
VNSAHQRASERPPHLRSGTELVSSVTPPTHSLLLVGRRSADRSGCIPTPASPWKDALPEVYIGGEPLSLPFPSLEVPLYCPPPSTPHRDLQSTPRSLGPPIPHPSRSLPRKPKAVPRRAAAAPCLPANIPLSPNRHKVTETSIPQSPYCCLLPQPGRRRFGRTLSRARPSPPTAFPAAAARPAESQHVCSAAFPC